MKKRVQSDRISGRRFSRNRTGAFTHSLEMRQDMTLQISPRKRGIKKSAIGAIGLAFTIGLAAFVWPPGTALAQTGGERAATKTAQLLVQKAHGALANGGLSERQRFSKLESAVRQTFAFSVWETFLLGKNANALSSKQRAKFRSLLPQYLAKLYMNQFGKGLRNKPEIGGAKTLRKDVLVRAKIPRATGGTLPVDWRLRNIGSRYRIIDFMVGGTSFLVLKRAEFNSVLKRSGPDELNSFLQSFISS